jgi:polygalacturonase
MGFKRTCSFLVAVLVIGSLVLVHIVAVVLVCDVDEYGAKGDAISFDTEAIQSALDACSTGGVVSFTSGKTYLTGGLLAHFHVFIRIQPEAVLLGSTQVRSTSRSLPSPSIST